MKLSFFKHFLYNCCTAPALQQYVLFLCTVRGSTCSQSRSLFFVFRTLRTYQVLVHVFVRVRALPCLCTCAHGHGKAPTTAMCQHIYGLRVDRIAKANKTQPDEVQQYGTGMTDSCIQRSKF